MLMKLALMAGEGGLRKLFELPAAQRAIADTAIALSDVEAGPALKTWMQSPTFDDFVLEAEGGRRTVTDEDVTAFVAASDFWAEKQTLGYARQVLDVFLGHLVTRLHEDDGLTIIEKHADRLHVKHEAEEERRQSEVLAAIGEIKQPVVQLPVSADASRPEPGEEAYAGRLDEARSLLQDGKYATAERILLRLDDDLRKAQASSTLRARIAVNLGVCRLQQDEPVEAEQHFLRALALKKDLAKAENGLALLRLDAERFAEAVEHAERSLAIEAADADASAIRLVALAGLGDKGQADGILADPAWIGDSAVRALAVGDVLYRQERYREAADTLKRAVALNPAEPQAHLLLALAVFVPIQTELRKSTPLPWRLPEHAERGLEEAAESMNRAIAILEAYEAEARLCDALTQRGAILATMSRDHDALRDFDRALSIRADHTLALRNKGMVLVQQDAYAEAEQCLEKAAVKDSEAGAPVLLAMCHLALGSSAKAAEGLRPLWDPGRSDFDRVIVGALLMRAYDNQGDSEAADAIESQISATWPADPQALGAVADRRSRRGDHSAAIGLLLEALANSGEPPDGSLQLQLAGEYLHVEKWVDAAELYTEIADVSRDNPILRRYVASLFNAGRYADARAVASSFRQRRNATPVITEVEARVEEYVGNLGRAIDLYLELDSQNPGQPDYRLQAAILCVKHSEHDRARELVRAVRPQDVWQQPLPLIQLAQLRHELGEPDVLSLAYQARRLDMDNPDIHLAYFHLMLNREEEPGEVRAVAVDTTVTLTRDGETYAFTILDDTSASRERNEIFTGDPLANRLMGKVVGDQLALGQDTPRGPIYGISEIRSKYVAAYQETLTKFMVWFPEHSGLRRVDVKDNDLSELLLTVDKSDERDRALLDVYLKGPVTIGSVAMLSGHTEIEVWGELTGEADRHLLVASGSLDDITEEAGLLADAQGFVLDVTAALTVSMLGLTQRLKDTYPRLYVSQGTIDEVNKTLHARFGVRRPTMTLSKEGGRYVRREITPESHDEGKRFVDELRMFLLSKCETVPHEAVLEMGADRYEQLRGLFGEPAITSILVASGLGQILYCDDAPLRNVAKTAWAVRSVSVQAILRDMQRRGTLSQAEYSAAIERLMLAQYRHLAVSVQDISWALEEASMGISPGVLALFEAVHGPTCSEQSAVQVVCGVLLHVWSHPIPMPNKMLILDLALTAVMTSRSPSRVAERLKHDLRLRFAAAPQALPAIYETIDLWVRQKRLGGRL